MRATLIAIPVLALGVLLGGSVASSVPEAVQQSTAAAVPVQDAAAGLLDNNGNG